MLNAFDILASYANGLIRKEEAEKDLDRQDIRGGFDNEGFTGYDYRKQEWIIVTWSLLRQMRLTA